MDAAAPRSCVPVPRAGARAHRERAIAPVPPRRQARGSSATEDCVDPRGDGLRRERARELAARAAGCARECDGRDPAPVVPRSARDPLRGSVIPRRGARARGRGAHLASRAIATRREPGSATARPGTATRFSQAFERTGDERWLERARRFAVHALAQVRRQRATVAGSLLAVHGRSRRRALPRELPRRAMLRTRSSTPD